MEILNLIINIIADLLGIYIVVTFCLWLKSKFRQEDNMISRAFESGIMPVMYDIGKTLLIIGLFQGSYYIMRTDRKNGIDKIKYATTGYIMLKFINWFILLVDRIATEAIKGL